MQFVKIAEVPRMLHRMRHSNTGKESIDKIQKMHNRTGRANNAQLRHVVKQGETQTGLGELLG